MPLVLAPRFYAACAGLAWFGTPQIAKATLSGAELPQKRDYVTISGRGRLGLGFGSHGVGGSVGAQIDYWFLRHVGFGVQFSSMGQSGILNANRASAWMLGSSFSARYSSASWSFFGGAGLGIGSAESVTEVSCDHDACFDATTSKTRDREIGYTISLNTGWLGRVESGLEIGPIIQIDTLPDLEVAALTGNLAMGFAF